MLLKDYRLEIFKSKCQADAKGVHCFAHLSQDVSEVLPYLNKDQIEPCTTGMPRPGIIDILKLLAKTNCRECGEPTCMVFATKVAEGAKEAEDCLQIQEDNSIKLTEYMSRFKLDL